MVSSTFQTAHSNFRFSVSNYKYQKLSSFYCDCWKIVFRFYFLDISRRFDLHAIYCATITSFISDSFFVILFYSSLGIKGRVADVEGIWYFNKSFPVLALKISLLLSVFFSPISIFSWLVYPLQVSNISLQFTVYLFFKPGI